jgi:hypothetical protein
MFGLKKNDAIGMIITAVVGFASGVFLYVVHFQKLTEPDVVAEQEELLSFSVTGTVYGSCTDACPAFRLEKTGAYRYRFTAERAEGEVFRDGFVPLQIRRAVRSAVEDADLAALSQPVVAEGCPSASGGIDFRYQIAYDGREYTIDSCSTAVDMSDPLWNSLNTVWQHLQTVE